MRWQATTENSWTEVQLVSMSHVFFHYLLFAFQLSLENMMTVDFFLGGTGTLGRETASEYERRVKKAQAEREAKEKEEEDAAVAKANEADLNGEEGCAVAASLLHSALCDGVIKRGLSVAR
jgi:hypothetical protein